MSVSRRNGQLKTAKVFEQFKKAKTVETVETVETVKTVKAVKTVKTVKTVTVMEASRIFGQNSQCFQFKEDAPWNIDLDA